MSLPKFRLCAFVAALCGTILPLSTPMAQPATEAARAPEGCTGPVSGNWLRLVVTGVRSSRGEIAITVYPDDSSRFLIHNGSLYVGRTRAVAGDTVTCVFLPRPGVYGIAIYHDENGNRKFDRTAIGLPAEAYGFSNNPPTLLGLPSFDSVRMTIHRNGLTSHIHLTYP